MMLKRFMEMPNASKGHSLPESRKNWCRFARPIHEDKKSVGHPGCELLAELFAELK